MDTALGDLLATLERRRDVLDTLASQPQTQAELAATHEVSRSTVTRAIQELGDHDLVERVDGHYRTTRRGETLLESHESYRARVEAIQRADAVFDLLPPEAPFDPVLLETGTTHVVEPGASFQVRELVTEQFRAAAGIRGLGRTRSEQASRQVYEQKIFEEGRPVENVISTDLFEHLQAEVDFSRYEAAENVEFYVHDSVPYGLFILEHPDDRRVLLLLYDEEAMKAVVCSTDTRAIEWAESVYRDYRDAAVAAATDGE